MAATKRRLTTLKSTLPTPAPRIPTIGQPGSWRSTGMTSAERGYGYAWQQARARHLTASPLCVYCERENGVTAASIVDHITPHRGDMAIFWDPDNWQSLCKPHHDSEKRREEQEAELRGEGVVDSSPEPQL
jgi:hypothetical protein